jgi:hypothetical protein
MTDKTQQTPVVIRFTAGDNFEGEVYTLNDSHQSYPLLIQAAPSGLKAAPHLNFVINNSKTLPGGNPQTPVPVFADRPDRTNCIAQKLITYGRSSSLR